MSFYYCIRYREQKNPQHFKFLFIDVQGAYAFNNRFLVCKSFCFVLLYNKDYYQQDIKIYYERFIHSSIPWQRSFISLDKDNEKCFSCEARVLNETAYSFLPC